MLENSFAVQNDTTVLTALRQLIYLGFTRKTRISLVTITPISGLSDRQTH